MHARESANLNDSDISQETRVPVRAGDRTATRQEADVNGDSQSHTATASQEEIRRVLRYELDLAILEKWREIAAIEEEIERGREVLALVERLLVCETTHVSETPGGALGPLGMPGSVSPALRLTPRLSRGSVTLALRRPTMCATVPAPTPSRFLVPRSVIVGNFAKRVAPENMGTAQPTHRWKLYVRSSGADVSDAELATWVRGVRFKLHASYSPDDVVTLWRPPFEVSRFGWADFPARVELILRDSTHNPCTTEIVHQIRVSDIVSPRYILAAEAVHHVCVHRRTRLSRSSPNRTAQEATDQLHVQQFVAEDGTHRQRRTYSSIPAHALSMDASDRDIALLSLVAGDFPLAGPRGPRAEATATLVPAYVPSPGRDEWLSMGPAQRAAEEIHRAEAIIGHIATAFPEAHFTMDASAVASWLRTSLGARIAGDAFLSSGEAVRFCWFCGLPHAPQDRFETFQRNCSMRPRKVHVSSRTSAVPLLAAAEARLAAEHALHVRSSSVRPLPEDSANVRIVASDALDAWVADALAPVSSSLPQVSGTAIPVLSAALRVFLADFVPACASEIPLRESEIHRRHRHETETVFLDREIGTVSVQPPIAVITPMHIFRAILSRPEFDFVSNAHMHGARPSSAAPGDDPLSAT